MREAVAASSAFMALTPKEREVLELAARNLSNKEIGLAMQVGEETIKWHMLEMARELFDHVLAGRIRGEPNQTFALADAAQAHRALESRQTTGATVLVP